MATFKPEHGGTNTILLCIKNIVYSFHMPLMFVISGYAFALAYVRTDEIRVRSIKKQLVNYTWSYVLWSAITVIVQQLVPGATSPDTFSDFLKIGIKSIGIYWYLYVLFFLYLIATLFAVKKTNLRCVFCISAIACLLYPLYGELTNLTIIDVLLYLVFFVLGMLLCREEAELHGIGLTIAGIFGLLVMAYGLILAFNGTMLSNLSIPIISTLGAFCISLWLVMTAKRYWRRKGIFTVLGRYSLEIFLMHSLIVAGIRVVLPKIGIMDIFLHILISLVVSMGFPILAALILKRIRLYDFVFRPYGKWKEIFHLFRKNRYALEAI